MERQRGQLIISNPKSLYYIENKRPTPLTWEEIEQAEYDSDDLFMFSDEDMDSTDSSDFDSDSYFFESSEDDEENDDFSEDDFEEELEANEDKEPRQESASNNASGNSIEAQQINNNPPAGD